MYVLIIKPLLDFILALSLLILFLPVLILVYVLIAVIERHNPIFFQVRPGYKGKPFTIVKFKTMTDHKDANNVLLKEDKRLTPLGRIIRKTSIDELPQLINVLKGDISLVGPRPLLIDYLLLYSKEQARRHSVKPGITGWAQVNGRNAISWKEKFEYDVWYVDNLGFLLDLKILFLTFYKVIKKEGVNKSEKLTMERFDGTN